MDDLLSKFKDFVLENRLIHQHDYLLVAVSGGVDSVVLYDLLLKIKDDFDLILEIIHLNHGIRGKQADEDQLFVEILAAEKKIATVSRKVDVLGFAKQNKKTEEESARILRYRFFEEMLDESRADAVAIGHNSDDQVETVLAHLIRGSGLKGMSGMAARRGRYIRPLLFATRKEIENYSTKHALEYRTDPTNKLLKYQRNKIRHELIPYLEKQFNPAIRKTILKTSQFINETESYLNKEAQEAFNRCLINCKKNKIILEINTFLSYFRVIQKHIIFIALDHFKVDRSVLNSRKFEFLLDQIEQTKTGNRIDLTADLQALVDHGAVIFLKSNQRTDYEFLVEPGKEYDLPNSFVLSVKEISENELPEKFSIDPKIEYIDYDNVDGLLKVRNFRYGDKFRPINLGGEKKVSDFFNDQKIPLHRRREIPLLVCQKGIVWIIGYRLDDRYKVTKHTKKKLKLQVMRVDCMNDTKCVERDDEKYVEFISEQQIKKRVKELAKQLSNDYRGKCPILIGVLNGAFVFLADLIREMDIACEVDFVKISSYGSGRVSSGFIKSKKGFDCDVDGRHILVVEDIADSGRSIKFLEKMFVGTKPASLKFVSLLLKEDNAVVDFKLDYVGFTIPKKFVVGYGLDFDQKDRDLKSIYVLDE